MQKIELQDVIRISFPTEDDDPKSERSKRVLIYFICGNPGLIQYYRDFLYYLYGMLNHDNGKIEFEIFGESLAGFETQSTPNYLNKPPPYNLQEQIEIVEQRLNGRMTGRKATQVILIGHSVGAYILMELLARRQASQKLAGRKETTESEIVGGICLFPTIVDLAKSPRGRIAAVCTSRHPPS